MKRWTTWAGALGLAALLAAAPALAQTKWVMATPYAENFHTANIRLFIAEVEKATEGKLAIQLHNNASLLPMGQIKRGVQTGQVQLGEILLSAYSNEDPFFEVDGVPFLAWTWPQAEALNAATEPYVRARLERQGLTLLYMAHWDAQGFYAKTETPQRRRAEGHPLPRLQQRHRADGRADGRDAGDGAGGRGQPGLRHQRHPVDVHLGADRRERHRLGLHALLDQCRRHAHAQRGLRQYAGAAGARCALA